MGNKFNRLAFSHPGKMGDALYALPTIIFLCEYHNTTCDFYTSKYCGPLIRLFEYQPLIDKVIIPEEYEIERMDMGVQPWQMPIPWDYFKIYHLGFRSVPDRPLHMFIAHSTGVRQHLRVRYECPDIETHPEPYIVVAPRGHTTFEDLFVEVIEKSPWDTVTIGGVGDSVGLPTIDLTGLDMLETTSWIVKSQGFVGMMSSQLALANGFQIPKVAPHDGKSWDMRHVITGPLNYYPVNPSAEEVLNCLQPTPKF